MTTIPTWSTVSMLTHAVAHSPSHTTTTATHLRIHTRPDLMLKRKTNVTTFSNVQVGEATVCRICNDIRTPFNSSVAISLKCIKQYLDTTMEHTVRHASLNVYSSVLSISVNDRFIRGVAQIFIKLLVR
jgi:hypothetical protein